MKFKHKRFKDSIYSAFVVWQMPGAVNGICAFHTAAAAAAVAAGVYFA